MKKELEWRNRSTRLKKSINKLTPAYPLLTSYDSSYPFIKVLLCAKPSHNCKSFQSSPEIESEFAPNFDFKTFCTNAQKLKIFKFKTFGS